MLSKEALCDDVMVCVWLNHALLHVVCVLIPCTTSGQLITAADLKTFASRNGLMSGFFSKL